MVSVKECFVIIIFNNTITTALYHLETEFSLTCEEVERQLPQLVLLHTSCIIFV